MRMSELGVFNTPVEVRDCTVGHLWGNYAKFTNREQALAAAHAINNHDRLTEENKRMREVLTRIIGSGTTFQNIDEMDNALDSDDIATIQSNFNDDLIRADKLLSELGE